MALEPIGDIGVANLTENISTETVTWDTATDWDNAASEAGVVHETNADADVWADTKILLGYPTFDRGGTALETYLAFDEDSGTTANDLSGNANDGTIEGLTLGATGAHQSTTFSGDGTSNGIKLPASMHKADTDPFTWSFWIKWDGTLSSDNNRCFGSDTTAGIGLLKDGGFVDGGNDLIVRYDSTSQSLGTNMTSGVWYHVAVTYDGSGTLTGYWDGSQVFQNTGVSWTTPDDTSFACYAVWRDGSFSSETWPGEMEYARTWTRELTSTEVSALHSAGTGGHLETATKSFSTSVTPDLQNLSYSLNAQTIDLKVIGSPGTASEEVVTQTLDGATSYTLTWASSHTDFRLRPEFSTTDFTASPTFSAGELVS